MTRQAHVIPFPRKKRIHIGPELLLDILIMSQAKPAVADVDDVSLCRLAKLLTQCGERFAMEFLRDLARGRDLKESVEDFSRINPSIYRLLLSRTNGGGAA